MWMTVLLSLILLLIVWKVVEVLNRKYFILTLAKRVQTADGSPLETKVFLQPGKTRFGNNCDILKFSPCKLSQYMCVP